MKKRHERPLTVEELREMPDESIDLDDIPELDEHFWKYARLREPTDRVERLALPLDEEVIAWFRSQGPDYEARMSAVLRAFYEARSGEASHEASDR